MSTKLFQWPGASITATFNATGGTPGCVMSVSAIAWGSLAAGQTVQGITPANNTIANQLTGSTGNTGTYQLQSINQIPFTNNPTGASYTTMGATGLSQTGVSSAFLSSTPYANATVAGWLTGGGTTGVCGFSVLGSIDGGAHSTTLATLLVTGSGNMTPYLIAGASGPVYDAIALQPLSFTGNGSTTMLGGAVRYAMPAQTSN